MHPDVIESAPGSCPICRMTLVPVRLEAVWTCPRHPQIARHEAGACPIDHRALIQMTVALSWTCPDHPEIDRIDRGVCPDGTPMVPKRTLRPHGNHNPQHGGQFFMAPDNFHHLEGAYPRPRLFRLYLYDDYARPLPAAQLKQVKARVVTSEVYDSRAGTTRELASFPLAARSGVLQATIDRLPLPARMSAKVRFKDDGPEYRFDFTFAAYTQEPAPAAGTLVKASGAAAAPRALAVAPSSAAAPGAATAAGAPPVAGSPAAAPPSPPPPVPDSVEEIVAQLTARAREVGDLIRQGELAAVYVPAFQARDLAIALEPRLDALDAARRAVAGPAIARLVRTAWLLDAFGDVGNRQQIASAYAQFTAAAADVAAAFRHAP